MVSGMARELKNILVNWLFENELRMIVKSYHLGSLIDIGCGNKPYKKLLAPYVTEHI